jgi:hypothetical protein
MTFADGLLPLGKGRLLLLELSCCPGADSFDDIQPLSYETSGYVCVGLMTTFKAQARFVFAVGGIDQVN